MEPLAMKLSDDLVAAHYASPLGGILLAATPNGLAGLWFEGQRYHPDRRAWPVDDAHPVLLQAKAQLADYFAGRRTSFDLPLDLRGGTPFQQSVWRALLGIPCGEHVTYGTLSRRIGKPDAVRAVGAAVGRNPVSIVVPCHRVLGADGSLTGYAGGLERKTALLRLEGVA
jgi:methylated-DNA-[protein]-cysteine S-methyltransferase